jgi:hypothetical protein
MLEREVHVGQCLFDTILRVGEEVAGSSARPDAMSELTSLTPFRWRSFRYLKKFFHDLARRNTTLDSVTDGGNHPVLNT